LHPVATCRISEVDTSTDPAVCAEESATLIPTMMPISATRTIALMFASLGSSCPSVYLVRRGTLRTEHYACARHRGTELWSQQSCCPPGAPKNRAARETLHPLMGKEAFFCWRCPRRTESPPTPLRSVKTT